MNSKRIVSAAAVASTLFASLAVVASDWYVDAANYGGTGQDGSFERPYGTIQQAIDAATTVAGDTILVRPGIYSNDVCTSDAYGSRLKYPSRIFVNKGDLTIRSTAGRAKTVIAGRRDPNSATGQGPESVACVFLDLGGKGFLLDGFTLRDGTVEQKSDSSDYNGGALRHYWCASGENVHLYDCAIVDCVCRDELMNYCQLHRCYVAGNTSTYSPSLCVGVADGGAENSLFVGNTGKNNKRSPMINCTVVGTMGGVKALYKSGAICGTILTLNGLNYDEMENSAGYTNCVIGIQEDSVHFPYNRNCQFGADATKLFVSPVTDDYRLLKDSVAVGLASSADLLIVPLPEGYVYRDFAGNVIDTSTAKPINAGAFQEVVTVAGGCCTFESATSIVIDGHRPLSPNLSFGYAETLPKTWEIAPAGDAELASVKYDGTYYYAGRDGRVSVPACTGDTATYTPAVGGTYVRYASPTGTDSAAGTRADPMSLDAALTGIAAGGLVIALRGDYDDSTPMNPSSWNTPARADVPEGVCLRSDEGAAVTTISGQYGGNDDGSGEGAVRCVVLRANARIEGFTLAHGRMTTTDDEAGVNFSAPGVCAYKYNARDPVVRDCIVTDCLVQRCVVMGGTFVNCQFLENTVNKQYFSYGSDFYGCLFARNRFGSEVTIAFVSVTAENITWAGDNMSLDGATRYANSIARDAAYIVNSLFFGKVDDCAATNCVFAGTTAREREHFYNCQVLTDESSIALDADYRPVVGSQHLVDAGIGECAMVNMAGTDGWDADASGFQRIMNRRIDIGALEGDWRPAYARDIRRVTVSAASSSVAETAEGNVELRDGSRVVLQPSAPRGQVLGFKVTGGGRLAIAFDGKERSFAASAWEQCCRVTGDNVELRYAGDPDGTATILRSRSGAAVIVR
ncbi:MAG: hypothetical protein ACI4RD_04455 [Kiritimatiellia bacterium]